MHKTVYYICLCKPIELLFRGYEQARRTVCVTATAKRSNIGNIIMKRFSNSNMR